MNDSFSPLSLGVGAIATVFTILIAVMFFVEPINNRLMHIWGKIRGGYTIEERLKQYSPRVARRLSGDFKQAGLPYPPKELALIAFKDTRILEVYGRMNSEESWRYIRQYPVIGASGTLGPKLVEGDKQVPEGLYHAEYLNPNSRFHLSIKLSYPNAFDKQMAEADGRSKLGGDIMVHGGSSSVGCLAMGDAAAEDLFVLTALASKENLLVLISPTDFRLGSNLLPPENPAWTETLYSEIKSALMNFQKKER